MEQNNTPISEQQAIPQQAQTNNQNQVSSEEIEITTTSGSRFLIASRTSRLVARLVDEFIYYILIGTIGVAFFFIIILIGGESLGETPENVSDGAEFAFTMTVVALVFLGLLLLVFLRFLFFAYIPYIWDGQTVGKRLMGIKTIHETGRNLTFGEQFLRVLIQIGLDQVIGFFQYILIIFHEKRQGIHDLIMKSYVIEK